MTDPRPLPPLESQLCRKCGYDVATMQWCAGAVAGGQVGQDCPWEGEHMHRVCAQCGYRWREAVRDVFAVDRRCGVSACASRDPCVEVGLPSGTVWLCARHGQEFVQSYRRRGEAR